MIVVDPDEVAWFDHGSETGCKDLVCLGTLSNHEQRASTETYLIILWIMGVCGRILCGDVLPEQVMEEGP